jgi:hypothetical protein
MMNAAHEEKVTRAFGPAQTEDTLRARICAEYVEMPGMCLTLPQAARLLNIEPTRCARLLKALVAEGVLGTDGRRFFNVGVGRQNA